MACIINANVLVRQKTSDASCLHQVKEGENYLAVGASYYGRTSNTTYCRKCGLKRFTEAAELLENLKKMLSKGGDKK